MFSVRITSQFDGCITSKESGVYTDNISVQAGLPDRSKIILNFNSQIRQNSFNDNSPRDT